MPRSVRANSFSGPRAEARRRLRRAVFWSVLTLLLATLLAGTWYLTRLPALTIESVEVSGGVTADEEALRERLEHELEGSYFLLVPKRFLYTYPQQALTELLEGEERIARAEVMRDGRTVSARITEYLPVALWCAALDELSDESPESGLPPDQSERCIFLAESGVAFARAPLLEGGAFLRYVTEARAPEEGVSFLPEERIGERETFAEALQDEHGMRVRAVVETPDGDLRYLLIGGGELIVAPGADVDEVFANLSSVLATEEFAHLGPGAFAYIDLRFGNRVFVKEEVDEETEEEPEGVQVATTTDAGE